MISEKSMASVYTDFQGLARLKTEAGKQTPEAIQETARQFEALFVQTMLKAMRDASPGEGMGESDQTEFYRDMYDQQMALHMVKGRGLGIARMLVPQLGGEEAAAIAETRPEPAAGVTRLKDIFRSVIDAASVQQPRPVVDTAPTKPLLTDSSRGPLVHLESAAPVRALVDVAGDVNGKMHASNADSVHWNPQTPDEFIRDLLPHARKGAAELGVTPGVLIAQAALETGWGQKVIRHADGRSSFNLFGIKADAGWSGDKVRVATLEYEDGIAEKQRASFRAYDSVAGAVSDYVDFIRSNPRYQAVLEQAADPDAYLNGLEAAGYATDPAYADKIRSIMQRGSFMENLGKLALSRSPEM